eukprot:COSAG01_NODE_6147_length_3824_cov_60.751946_3_plen_105_part_00
MDARRADVQLAPAVAAAFAASAAAAAAAPPLPTDDSGDDDDANGDDDGDGIDEPDYGDDFNTDRDSDESPCQLDELEQAVQDLSDELAAHFDDGDGGDEDLDAS